MGPGRSIPGQAAAGAKSAENGFCPIPGLGGGGLVGAKLSTARFIAACFISSVHPVPLPLQAPRALHQRGIFF